MSKFNYILPSGKKFVVTGPNGATQEQADKIFYEQVLSGSLVGFVPGDQLTSLQETIEKFGLSRLDRGIAGVEDTTILSVTSGKIPIPENQRDIFDRSGGVPSGTTPTAPVSVIASRPGRSTPKNIDNVVIPAAAEIPVIIPYSEVTSFDALINVPIVSPINEIDVAIVTDGIGPNSVGPLNPTEVRSLEAQKVNLVGQSYEVITQEKGIGKYGFNCIQLEKTGYVKPSTSQIYLGVTSETQPNPINFIPVMKSPSIWTGKDGVTGLEVVLSNEEIQNQIYNELMQVNYRSLLAGGIIIERNESAVSITEAVTYPPTPFSQTLKALNTEVLSDAGALVNLSATYGPEAASSWAQGGQVVNPTDFSSVAKAAKGAVNFANNFLSGLSSGVKTASGYDKTVDRSTVDAAVTRIIGNSKVPSPTFSPESLQNDLDISQAQRLLAFAQNAGKNIINRLT